MASGDLSLTSTSSQEEESPEYVAYDRTIRPSSNSSGSTDAANITNNNSANNSNFNANTSTKKFEIIKTQYDSALMELSNLRHQHSDTVRRCEDLTSQLSFFQGQYMAAINQIKNSDRNKFTDIVSENAHLKQQNAILEAKLMQLVESVNKPENEKNVVQMNKNAFYCGYDNVAPNKCDACADNEKLIEELQLCKERNADLIKEHNAIVAEREKYKKIFSSAVMDLESIKKERNFYRDSREQFNLQREQMEKEIEKLKALIATESNKVLMITIQRSRIEEELNQLLSEKDNVLQEHQKMSDDLALANKELDKFKKDELVFRKEIKALQQSNSEFKRRDLLKSRESSWSKEFSDSKDDSKEVEKLRKGLEKAYSEIERAVQDAEEAKRVRDWAISQREKIVQERDSVKTLCDNLRKERDKAISDLLSAIRDSEKIKKQKDEAQKEIDILKDQIESQHLDSTSCHSFRINAYEAEHLLDIELCNYHTDSDLGVILDDTNNRQLVCGVTNTSPAFGKLKINDVICKVNNLDSKSMSKRMVLEQIRSCAPRCNLLVSRTRHTKRHFYTVHLNLLENPNHGLSIEQGVFISKISQNSMASFQPELDVGDRVLSINNKSMDCFQSSRDIMNFLNDERNESITIFALKNIQDVCLNDFQRRMTTSSAQTESVDSMHRVTNSKHPSKIAEMLSKFKEKIHISKPGTDADNFAQENDALAALDSVLSENSSEKSKENLFKRSKRNKKEKEVSGKSMGTWPRTNILNGTHENPSATIVHREKKRIPLSLFTRGYINADKEDCEASGEPPPLPPQTKPSINLRNGSNLIKKYANRNSNPIPVSALYQNANLNSTDKAYSNYIRHSVYGAPSTLEQEPILEQTKPLQRPAPLICGNMRVKIPFNEKHASQRNYQNRYSLNITPTESYKSSGQQAQQQVMNSGGGMEILSRKQHFFDMLNNLSTANGKDMLNNLSTANGKAIQQTAFYVPLNTNNAISFPRSSSATQQNSSDIISLKSQNSIDSILSAKSPPISEYAISNYPKRSYPMPQAATSAIVKNVCKYPSDSESIVSGIIGSSNSAVTGGAFCSNNMQQNRHTQLFPTFTQSMTHSQSRPMRQIRHSSPLSMPSSPPLHPHPIGHHINSTHSHVDVNGSTVANPISPVDKFEIDYGLPGHSHHSHALLHDYSLTSQHQQQQNQPHYPHVVSGNASGGIYEGGTFPRKKDHQRLRKPSNPNVANKVSTMNAMKNSTGSIDQHFIGSVFNPTSSISTTPLIYHSALVNAAANGVGSGRGSPMPQVHVEVLSHGGSKRNVPTDFLCPGDLRRVTIEKSDKSLGITIQCNNNGGGIFVSTVADKSIATRAGLQVGDQLLEVCGLNMRSATNDIAANVLRQCGNSITMLVQYNPEKFHCTEYDGTNNLESEASVNHSGSPTPRNSPRPPVRGMMTSLPHVAISTFSENSFPQTIMHPSGNIISNPCSKDDSFPDSLENNSHISNSQHLSASTTTSTTSSPYNEGVRYITLHLDKSKNLGIKLFGGNKVGIYVHDVHPGSPSDEAGIRKGDQILEYNGADLRCVTAEQAANEISKLSDTVTMLVQNKLKKLKLIKDKSGDSFYIRTGFDRVGDLNEGDLRFVKDEVLYVDNTIFGGTFGLWRAWKLDAKGHRKECGIIPSQIKVEEELRSGEAVDCEGSSTRRGSISARRSFFRRKKHQCSSSRDSTEIASFSNTQLSFFPDSGMLNEDGGILSYQRVERLDSPVRRPVLIIGPLSECVMDRLTIDFSNLFKLCEVTSMDCSQEAMEEGLQENIFVDYRRRDNKFECTTIESISNTCKNDRRHCILDMSISAVERLQRLHIYPIVLLLRFKSPKQIREIRDFGTDKISAKAAKEMYDRALKLENDYKQYISAVIPGVSIKHMCTQIKDSVDKEQDKLLWVPVACG